MHFLLDANLPRSLATLIRRVGHTCSHVRDVELGAATDAQIAAHARAHRLTLVTRDYDFADVRNYPPEQYAGIVVLQLPDTATATTICTLAEQFFDQREVIAALAGRLAIVEFGRVRLRPPMPAE